MRFKELKGLNNNQNKIQKNYIIEIVDYTVHLSYFILNQIKQAQKFPKTSRNKIKFLENASINK